MEEKLLFERGNVQVTTARFIVGGHTYAVRNITSTAASEQPQKWAIAVVFGLVALLMLPGQYWLAAVACAALAVGAFFAGHPIYFVQLHTSGGEKRALDSKEKGFITDVVNALNEAIVSQHK
jgi:hypothetical protein